MMNSLLKKNMQNDKFGLKGDITIEATT